MQAERTALTPAVVKREIRKIVAHNGHKLSPFDMYDSAECSHCRAIMALDDAHDVLAGDTDALGSFNEQCPQDDPAALILWFARLLQEGEVIAIPGVGVWVARTKAGLRAGFGWTALSWPRGDAQTLVREQIAMQLDARQTGYFAHRYRGEFALWLRKPLAFPITGVGRTAPQIDVDSARRLV